MATVRRRTLEEQLTPQQRRAAQLIVQNDWAELLSEDGRKKTMQEIAEEVGIARSTLYEWKAQEQFIEYVNYLTDKQLESMRSEVNVAIMKAIRGGNNGLPSVKALDLYMRRWGLLTNVEVIDDRRERIESRRKTDEEVRKDIAELDAMINGNEAG
ncbi:phBC6A51 family helix-turn-helix protein [Paenibacillus ehimensis]|uniref:PhBC6A51 family helix-turn-helix protein n=1 Tax=Paenibacillus ehimensis TaxID=79264 RepID=A0ABT8VL78_9BACL|nr:phBC6A51 family helix-turn-helix protein [Paenibacillus ehimensis]MDO3681696.1 phBC6A51 family helix-turn-helix protein [Paenibacillus ehimensis]